MEQQYLSVVIKLNQSLISIVIVDGQIENIPLASRDPLYRVSLFPSSVEYIERTRPPISCSTSLVPIRILWSRRRRIAR